MRKVLPLTCLVMFAGSLMAWVEVDRLSRTHDVDSIVDSLDFILSSPDRRWLTSVSEIVPPPAGERLFMVAVFEGNSRGEYYRKHGVGIVVNGFKPTFGIGLDDGKSILIDEYLRAADYDAVVFFSGTGPKTLASIEDIFPQEEVKRRLDNGGIEFRWLASAEVQGNKLKLKLCGDDGKPAVPERIVELEIDKTREFRPYVWKPQ